ncbi:MAG: hypothetical protein EOP67_30055, partial [Sphingomonas sp.]
QRATGLLVQVALTGPRHAVLGEVDMTRAISLAPGGRARMHADADRPSRAARKVEEALAWLGVEPGPGEVCVDLGAAPGGWSWALLKRRARVIAVDPALLRPDIASHRGLTHAQASAFDFAPDEPVDWLFCDMAWRPIEVAQMLAFGGRTIDDQPGGKRILCQIDAGRERQPRGAPAGPQRDRGFEMRARGVAATERHRGVAKDIGVTGGVGNVGGQGCQQIMRRAQLPGLREQNDLGIQCPRSVAGRRNERIDRAMGERRLAADLHQLRYRLPLRPQCGVAVEHRAHAPVGVFPVPPRQRSLQRCGIVQDGRVRERRHEECSPILSTIIYCRLLTSFA